MRPFLKSPLGCARALYSKGLFAHQLVKIERKFAQEEHEAAVLIAEALEKHKQAAPSTDTHAEGTQAAPRDSRGKLLCKNFLGSLIKNGVKQDLILAMVNTRLKLLYQTDNPIQLAVDAVKPIVEYRSVKGRKQTLPRVLSEHRRNGQAVRWIIEAASARKYNGHRDLERGLFDEITGILDGASPLYAKRFNMHKPN